jgi:hypothetical protein
MPSWQRNTTCYAPSELPRSGSETRPVGPGYSLLRRWRTTEDSFHGASEGIMRTGFSAVALRFVGDESPPVPPDQRRGPRGFLPS